MQHTINDILPRRRAVLARVGVLLAGAVLATTAVGTGAPVTAAAVTAPQTVLSASFNDLPRGWLRGKDFAGAVGQVSTWDPNYEDTMIRPARSHGMVVRTRLEEGTIRSAPKGNNGTVVPIRLPGSYESACVRYDIRFLGDFDWSLGGKLPGLVGVAPGVSPTEPSGGGRSDRGFSARIMWLGPKAYRWAHTGSNPNMAVSYVYSPGRKGTWGDNYRWNTSFEQNRWHTIKQCVQLNDVGAANGTLQAWFDGHSVLDERAMTFRIRDDVRINYLTWDIFRGGNTMDWAGAETDYIDIDNLSVSGAS